MEVTVLGVDPRALLTDRLETKAPLPFISRRRLAKVRHRVEPPSQCPHCGGPVELVSNAVVYGLEQGAWPYLYLCSDELTGCGAYVGLHHGTDLPYGLLATPAMRRARALAKPLFRATFATHFQGDVSAAYKWLANKMGIPRTHCHFGLFTVEQCDQVRAILEELA